MNIQLIVRTSDTSCRVACQVSLALAPARPPVLVPSAGIVCSHLLHVWLHVLFACLVSCLVIEHSMNITFGHIKAEKDRVKPES